MAEGHEGDTSEGRSVRSVKDPHGAGSEVGATCSWLGQQASWQSTGLARLSLYYYKHRNSSVSSFSLISYLLNSHVPKGLATDSLIRVGTPGLQKQGTGGQQ